MCTTSRRNSFYKKLRKCKREMNNMYWDLIRSAIIIYCGIIWLKNLEINFLNP